MSKTTACNFNELSLAPPDTMLDAAYEACRHANRYPCSDTGALRDALMAHDVIVNALPPFGARVTVGTSEDTDCLEAAWQKIHPLT